MKVVLNLISNKKVSGRICLSPPRVQLGGPKDQYVWNLLMYRNGKLDSLWGSTLPKIRIFWKKASNKSCSKSNFSQKSRQAHTAISSMSGARGLQRSLCLKSYNVQKLEIRFSLGLNPAKNTHFLKKKLQIKNFWNRISHKKVRSVYVYLPNEWNSGAPKISMFEIL